MLLGGGVGWIERGADGVSVRVWTPRDGSTTSVYRDSSRGVELGGSPRALLLARSWWFCPPPAHVPPQPGDVIYPCRFLADALAGPHAGPFEKIAEPLPACIVSLAGGGELRPAADLDGSVVAYLEPYCPGENAIRIQLTLRDIASADPARVVFDREAVPCCIGIRVAGRFVAWGDTRDRSVVVYDAQARRTAYVARLPAGLWLARAATFDLQSDGTLAVTATRGNRPTRWLGWWSVKQPFAHPLGVRALDGRIRLAAGRIAFRRQHGEHTSELDVVTLGGRLTRVARFAAAVEPHWDFDFDGRAVTWASHLVSERRRQCGPEGHRWTCRWLTSGVTTIWRRSLESAAPYAVERLPFVDVPRP